MAIATARTEAIRLAKRIHQADADLKANYANIAALVADSPAAQLTQEIGIGPSPLLSLWWPGHTQDGSAMKQPLPHSPGPAPYQHPPGKPLDIDLTAVATAS